ncbi:HtaA domain-containing protein [Actinospongicola halichondriae]|uniref:HtaA domain-containing protein n=1 Tax=Actinospongicola halichondriae TaxID=3236844 RepID=UPI003D52C9F6
MRPFISRSSRAILAVVVALAASPLAAARPVAAAPTEVSGGTLDWAISAHVETSASLNGARSAGTPVTDDGSQWHFSSGVGSYEPDTGALDLELPGHLEFGNTVRGNYGFRLANVSVHVDDSGDGRIEADVAVRPPFQPYGSTVADVTVVTFSDASGVVADESVTWTVTPDTDVVPADTPPAFEGARQFPQSFLAAVTGDFEDHFRQTNTAGADDTANVAKLPATLTFSVEHEAAGGVDQPSVEVTPSADLDPAGATVSISGSGFGGASDGVYVRLCAAADGETGTVAGRPGADRCLGDPQLWVSNFPGASAPMGEGSFDVDLDVVATFTGSEGAAFDCGVDQCGIATRRDHFGGADDFSLDTFTPISFAESDPTDPDPTDPDPTDPDPTDPMPVDGDGALDWGVKASFRNYIENGPAAGTVETVDPAERNEDGTFRFELDAGLDFVDVDDVFAPFAGGVHFSGHAGSLDLVITEPRVDVDGTTGTLVVDAVSKELESPESQTFDDVVLATLDLRDVTPTADDDRVRYADIPATLTEDGADAFGGFYEAGEALDPVTFVITADSTGLAPTPRAPAGAVTCIADVVTAGASVDVCGEGFTPGEQVQVFLHSSPRFLSVVQADADGGVAAPVVIPVDVTGEHRIELRGVTSGRSIFSQTFTVHAAPSRTPVAGTLPATGSDSTLLLIAFATIAAGLVLVRTGARSRP